jgi:hypothetical protein
MQRIVELHSFQGDLGLLGGALMVLAIPRPGHSVWIPGSAHSALLAANNACGMQISFITSGVRTDESTCTVRNAGFFVALQ